MALSALIDKSRSPTAADVRQVLGETHQLWDRIVSVVTTRHFPIENVWSHGGAKYGWTLRLKRMDRVLVYLTPQNAFLLAGFALGERAVAAALEAGVPEAVRALIEAAPRYAEGRGVRIPVHTEADADAVLAIVAAKAAN